MNIIYRIYREVERNSYYSLPELVLQDVMMCNSKEEFKEAIKLTYGDDIKFKHTKGLNPGDLFVSIISYDCYNAQEYVSVQEYKCAYCGKTFKTNKHSLITFNVYNNLSQICSSLYSEKANELEHNTYYCCETCKSKHYSDLVDEFKEYAKEHDLIPNEWVIRENERTYAAGYIYMISKRSTKEFYVGQTNSVPMFRWVQHLKTDRFDIKNITDYIFEVLEVVKDIALLNNREAYWIQKKYEENPELCLNIVHPKEKEIVSDKEE